MKYVFRPFTFQTWVKRLIFIHKRSATRSRRAMVPVSRSFMGRVQHLSFKKWKLVKRVPTVHVQVLAFQTEDIAESMAQVVAAGGTLLNDRPQPCPVGIHIGFKDPAGVLHELLQFAND